ncbi:HDIG domain-containing protein [Lutibacter sp. B2]|nr:HDIG domain-containing protein [Lutibacter sp. B2]
MTFIKGIINRLNSMLVMKLLGKRTVTYVMVVCIFFITIFTSTIINLAPNKYELEVGQQASIDFKAPRDVEDHISTERAITKAIESVKATEILYPTIQIDVKKKIEKFFTNVYKIKEIEEISEDEKILLLKEKDTLSLTDDELRLLIFTSDKEIKNMESYIYEMVTQVMTIGIKEEELETKKIEIKKYFNGLEDFTEEIRLLGTKIVNSSIQLNRFVDVETTQRKIEEAKNSVDRVIIRRGNIIVAQGETITPEKLKILKDVGIVKGKSNEDFSLYLGVALLVIFIQAVLIIYIYVFHKNIFLSVSKMYLILIIFLCSYFVCKRLYDISPYVVPIGTAAILLGVLIDARFAIVINLSMTVLIAISNGYDIGFFITSIMAAIVGVCGITRTHQRSNLFLSGFMISLSNIMIIFGLGFINHHEITKILVDSFYGMLNGIFCAIVAIGSLPLLESVFKILTPFKLLELSNPNHPILKKLLLEAPGTYHHSIIVGNLSEAAADAIGANGLLARVSAYYHDIGKLKRPYLFKENQLTSENPHDKMRASLSAMIIISHVKDGTDIGIKNKLPKEIVDIINQHHGKTLVKYFYHKATKEENNNINENDYRYKGEKPQSKEAAIVMLADSTEAAVRSIPEPTAEKIGNLIDKIIEDKLADGQLNECEITLKDLREIAITFKTVLMGIFHERIEYPELENRKIEVTE